MPRNESQQCENLGRTTTAKMLRSISVSSSSFKFAFPVSISFPFSVLPYAPVYLHVVKGVQTLFSMGRRVCTKKNQSWDETTEARVILTL